MAVKPIPDDDHTLKPCLFVTGVARLIEFLKQAFDAKEVFRMDGPDGTVIHAELKIGDSPVMLGETRAEPPPMPGVLYMYVKDTDAVYRRALEAGATSLREPADQFYGDRNASVKDPSGNHWWIATHKEDLSPEELARRSAAHAQGSSEAGAGEHVD